MAGGFGELPELGLSSVVEGGIVAVVWVALVVASVVLEQPWAGVEVRLYRLSGLRLHRLSSLWLNRLKWRWMERRWWE